MLLPVRLLLALVAIFAFSAQECTDSRCDEAYLWGGEFIVAHPGVSYLPGIEELDLQCFGPLKLFC